MNAVPYRTSMAWGSAAAGLAAVSHVASGGFVGTNAPSATSDNAPPVAHRASNSVTDVYTKTEVDAKINLVEEKAKTSEATISGKLDRIIDNIDNLTKDLSEFKADTKEQFRTLNAEVKSDYKSTRTNIWVISIGGFAFAVALLALTFAAQGSMTTAVGNTLSAFQAGQSVPVTNTN